MHGTLVVNSWVGIREGCDITYRVNGSDDVYVTVNGSAEPFEFFFQASTLRQFVELGSKALAEMDGLAEQEEVEWNARQQRVEFDQSAEQSA